LTEGVPHLHKTNFLNYPINPNLTATFGGSKLQFFDKGEKRKAPFRKGMVQFARLLAIKFDKSFEG
jgi:hypothetical protein